MTRVIELDARAEDGQVLIPLPADIPDGPLHLIITIATPTDPSISAADDLFGQLQPLTPTGWPAGTTYRREDLYDDDGR